MANSDPEVAGEALCRGASWFLLKTHASSELVVAVWEVMRGAVLNLRNGNIVLA